MKTIHIDCSSGVAGDMFLGAFIDLGVDPEAVKSALATLPVHGFELTFEKVTRNSIAATHAIVHVDHHHHHHHRGLGDVLSIIEQSGLNRLAKDLATHMFTRLGEAEARVHATTADKVHFHEVGAVDAIVDICGAAVCVDLLGEVIFTAAPVRTGFGSVRAAHGMLPVPAPGTAALLTGIPAFAGEIEGEWATPTGVAILGALAGGYGQMPAMTVHSVGYGAGTREHPDLANILRLIAGERQKPRGTEITIIEAEIDDMNPQIFGHLYNRLSGAGALDWYVTPVQMKKNRPGSLLTVLCRPEMREKIADILFRETTTIGYRHYAAEREELLREIVIVRTEFGEVGIKIARRDGELMNAQPEYEDCRRLAESCGLPLKRVQELAMRAFHERARK